MFAEKDPNNLPWKALDVDVVLECTGVFTSKDKAMAHINAGAKSYHFRPSKRRFKNYCLQC